MPVPTHLKTCVIFETRETEESPFRGAVKCSCGSDKFLMLFPGETHEYDGEQVPCTAEIDGKFFFLVTAKCSNCSNEHLIIDQDFHGWNGFVCHDAVQAALPRPKLKPWACSSCNSLEHQATVEIQTEGKADFVENVESVFPDECWPDGFGWINISITCSACGQITQDWISLETM